MKKSILIALSSTTFLLFMAFIQYKKYSDGYLHVVFCDVGQGDAIYISTPQRYDILIDGGPSDSVVQCLESHMPFWDRNIDVVFMTHFNADHYNGLLDIIENYHVSSFLTGCMLDDNSFKDFIETFVNKKTNIKLSHFNDEIRVPDGVVITTYWPKKTLCDKEINDLNATSLVQRISYGNIDTILNGDIPFDILNRILLSLNDDNNDVEIFKLPHHGSKTGINEQTFELIKPELSIISSGRQNRYGHPHKQVLDLLANKNLKYLRTDEKGDIEIVSDGNSFWIR